MKWLLLVLSVPGWSLGQAYSEIGEEAEGSAPWQEIFVSESVLERSYEVGVFRKVVIVGDMDVILKEGAEATLTIRGNRAVMSQVGVRNWNGELTLSVDTGLLGPRERGRLEVNLVPGKAAQIEIREGVDLNGSWSSAEAVALSIRSESSAELALRSPRSEIEVTWNSRLVLPGTADTTRLLVKDPVRADLSGFKTGALTLDVRDNAEVILGTTGAVEGRIYRGGVLRVDGAESFAGTHPGLRVEGEILGRQ